MPPKEHIFLAVNNEDMHNVRNEPRRAELVFITSTGGGKIKNDEPARTIIRMQAISKAAEQRRGETAKSQMVCRQLGGQLLYQQSSIPQKPSAKGYEVLRARYGIDIATLSILTTFHVGRVTVNSLCSDPQRLRDLLQGSSTSYFSHLPSRFEHAPYLEDAFECVAARVRQLLAPHAEMGHDKVLSTYAKALRSMQAALDNHQTRDEPELLGAISVLSLFELLDASRQRAWMHHAAAARSLVRRQGPYPRTSEFEKALFIAQTGPIITESSLENEHCFLEEPEWQLVFQSVITEGKFHERSTMVVLLRMIMAAVPGIVADTSEVVCSERKADMQYIEAIRANIRECRTRLMRWHQNFNAILADVELASDQQDLRTEVLGTYMACVILVNRMGVALGCENRQELEDETITNARLLVGMVSSQTSSNPHTYFFKVQKMKVAYIALVTAAKWKPRSPEEGGCNHSGIISPSIFRAWSRLLGRKVQ